MTDRKDHLDSLAISLLEGKFADGSTISVKPGSNGSFEFMSGPRG